jgi:hypothetical protein
MRFTHRAQRRAILLLAAASLACAPAPRMGEAVDIAEESAIIIWDAAEKTQHFIRRATFETKSKDFGFLVPTPTVPELKEADDDAFALLERLTVPPRFEVAKSAEKKAVAKAVEAPKVEVIARVKVAGYDAAVLKANDAGALDAWLKDNSYHSSPELVDWYKPYVARNWIITAFKIDAGAGGRVEGSAVRMSFKTEQPFFPYREPAMKASAGSAPRILVVYYLGDARPDGRIGDSGAWPGRTAWSGSIQVSDKDRLLNLLKLPLTTAPGAYRLTRFTDGSSPRPGSDDLFFSAAADQSEVPDPKVAKEMFEAFMREHRRRQLEERIWIGAVLLTLAGIGLFLYRRRKRGSPTR